MNFFEKQKELVAKASKRIWVKCWDDEIHSNRGRTICEFSWDGDNNYRENLEYILHAVNNIDRVCGLLEKAIDEWKCDCARLGCADCELTKEIGIALEEMAKRS